MLSLKRTILNIFLSFSSQQMFIFSTNTLKNKHIVKKSPILYHFLVAKWQLRSCRVISIPQIRISAKISSLALYHYWGRAPALYRDYIARPKRANLKRIIGVARKPNTLVSLYIYRYIYIYIHTYIYKIHFLHRKLGNTSQCSDVRKCHTLYNICGTGALEIYIELNQIKSNRIESNQIKSK